MERYIGKMLDNRYEVLEVIGTGGMAVVFKAKCHRLNRMVAIKMLKKDLSEDAEFRRRFHDESQAVAMLSHPNIMAVYDVSRGGAMDYIVMELIDGITLKQYMERRGKLNWPEALHFITQIMKGLSHAHSRGIVHRDIKPQNIMVLRDGTVKVTDFGIAFLSNGSNPSNEAIGSVHYISPEQAKGDYTDNRSDIYSAGVVLYEMLTSRLPFDGADPVSVAIQHFSAVPLSPREVNPEIPEALEQICMKAMAPDRNKRYAAADEMLMDLEAFRKDPSVSFDYSAEDLRGGEKRGSDDEPTQYLPNVAVTRSKQQNSPRLEPVYDDEDGEEVGRPRRRWILHLVVVALCAALGYFAVTRIYDSIMSSFSAGEIPEYAVPSVVGMTVEEARDAVAAQDVFEIVVEQSVNSAEYPAGEIMFQDPEAERMKKPDSEGLIPISVKVSLGVRSGEMPPLTNIEFRTAKVMLEQGDVLGELGLTVVEGEQEYHEEIPAGSVIRSEPAAGAPLSEGDTVTLIVSKGPEIKYSTMPFCVGEDMEVVQRMMDEAKLKAEFTEVEGSEPEGQVLSQSIEVGTEVPEGTTVTFTFSNGEKLLERKVVYDVPFSLESVYVEIYVDTTQVFASDLAGDTGTLEVPIFQKAGTYELRIYVDGRVEHYEVITFGE